jgi:hypothetical protein
MLQLRIALPHQLGAVPKALPNVAHALTLLAQQGVDRWSAYAAGKALPGGAVITPRSGSYLRSIQTEQVNPYLHRVFNDAPHADAIERGSKQRDLKKMLDSSVKVRVTKDGRRYLIIPFRWGTGTGSGKGISFGAQVMPKSVHALASNLTPSRIVGHGWRQSGTGAHSVRTRAPLMVRQRQYKWGGRLGAQALADAGVTGKHAQRMSGMVKMQRNDGKHTTYMTFRIMMEGAQGWIVPPQPGKYPARTVAQEIERAAPALLRRALEADMAAIVR